MRLSDCFSILVNDPSDRIASTDQFECGAFNYPKSCVMNDENSDLLSVVRSSVRDSNRAGIRFENAEEYNRVLEPTFERTVTDTAALGSNFRILEVGSFTGVVSLALQRLGHAVTASDIPFVVQDPGFLRLFSESGVNIIGANLNDLPFPAASGSYDLIIFNEVLEHLNFNPIPLLREFHRILAPAGRVYCATPNLLSAKNRWRMIRGLGYLNPVEHLNWNLTADSGMSVGLHWREWTRAELIELFNATGFVLESHRFGLTSVSGSRGLRKLAVKTLYALFPGLMPNQVGVFAKKPPSGEAREVPAQ